MAVAISLFTHRRAWAGGWRSARPSSAADLIDRVTKGLDAASVEVPVGFKWFVDGLRNGSLGFGGEESAGSILPALQWICLDTHKDAIIPALLSAEITARVNRDPGELYRELERDFGAPVFKRVDAPASPAEKRILARCHPSKLIARALQVKKSRPSSRARPEMTRRSAAFKVIAENGWFAARPSGTEDIYKIYAESFRGTDHLQHILEQAETIVADALGAASKGDSGEMRSAG